MLSTGVKGAISLADYLAAALGITESVGSVSYVYTQTMGKDGTPSISKIPASFLKLSPTTGGKQVNIPGVDENAQIAKAKKLIDAIVQKGDKAKLYEPKMIHNIISKLGNVPLDASASDLINKVKGSLSIQKSIQDMINKGLADPIYQIGFGGRQPSKPTRTAPAGGSSSSSSSSSSRGPKFKIPDMPPIYPPTGGMSEEEEKKKKEEKKEKDKDKPRIPEIREPKFDESPIAGPVDQHPDNKKHSQPNPTLWYPEYKFGGQNLLRLTDTEKIQEMKDWTLYDLVIPILDADSENLLAIQNQIKEKLRFYNTYKMPKPEPELPAVPKSVNSWGNPWLSTYPVPYPFQLDQGRGNRNNYYGEFSDQLPTEQNRNLNKIKQPVQEPDMAQILNSKKANNANNILNLDLTDDDLLFMALRK